MYSYYKLNAVAQSSKSTVDLNLGMTSKLVTSLLLCQHQNTDDKRSFYVLAKIHYNCKRFNLHTV